MNIIKPYIEIEDQVDGKLILEKLERIGRVCYKSECKIDEGSAKNFLQNIIKRKHESVLEHVNLSIRIVCDRGVSHEIVRHRIASYSQESTRYCNYANDKFNSELTFIKPCFWTEDSEEYKLWKSTMLDIEKSYMNLVHRGVKPQEARSLLPNSIKTELVMTMNIRSWRNFLNLRTDVSAHPQIREVAFMILNELKSQIPILFDDIKTI